MDLKNAAKAGAKGTIWTLWNVIFPLSAVKRTVALTRREIDRNKENFQYLKELSARAKHTLEAGEGNEQGGPGRTFEEAMASRSADAPSIVQLYRSFLLRKRWALSIGALFAVSGLYAVVGGLVLGHYKDVLLGGLSLLVSQPAFFLAALGAQLRLWQLKTKRLSVEERGGVRDFMADYPDWFWQLINPEMSMKRSSNYERGRQ